MQDVHLQQGGHIQCVPCYGVQGGYPSQQGSMVVQPEISLDALPQWFQQCALKCRPQLIIIHLQAEGRIWVAGNKVW